MKAALLAPLAFLLALIGTTTASPTEAALLVGLAAVAIAVALGAAHRAQPTHTASVAVRARRRRLDQGAPPRQHDPDAAGHTRGRAPDRATAAV
jgi:hypothetical protein